MTTLLTREDRPKGVVNPVAARKAFRLERYLPEPDLAPFVDYFWLVEWRLPDGVTHVQRTLPYPCANLVFDRGATALFGVVTGAFEYTLRGHGRVLGVRFRPGGLRGLLGIGMHAITDRTVPMAPLFGVDEDEAERQVFAAPGDAGMIKAASALLRPCLGAPDDGVTRIASIVDIICDDQTITQVRHLSDRTQMSVRRLQLLFREWVGVGPKWVIRRNRLHDAADQLVNGEEVDLASLAQSLGYFDQAHFTSDFEKLLGRPPADYRRACRAQAPV